MKKLRRSPITSWACIIEANCSRWWRVVKRMPDMLAVIYRSLQFNPEFRQFQQDMDACKKCFYFNLNLDNAEYICEAFIYHLQLNSDSLSRGYERMQNIFIFKALKHFCCLSFTVYNSTESCNLASTGCEFKFEIYLCSTQWHKYWFWLETS